MSYTGIIKWTCPSCTNSHREVYYKRITKRKTFKPYYYMFNNWRSCDNELNVDFEMYGTYKDALQGTNLWTWCSYDDPGIGFPRDCGPTGQVTEQWNSVSTAQFFFRGPRLLGHVYGHLQCSVHRQSFSWWQRSGICY
mmetsp:Transcript_24636/g.61368  ORF Transcript_24636/g.61368 Transcript_24636/m.61368 type:complete len:138 (+) Transcript_24636:1274-1687(+)